MEYKIVKIKDIVSALGDGIHGTPKYSENGEYYFINGNNLSEGKIIIKQDTKKVSLEEYEKYKKELNDRTLLVSINGTLGNVAVYNNEKCILGKSACYFNVKENVNKQFIKYILYSNEFQKYIQEYATGTTIKNMSLKAMREYEFKLPAINMQNKIENILSRIDQKIETNNKINDNLYKLNKLIYKEKIDSIKCNYSETNYKKLDDIVIINSRGLSPSYVDSGIPVINQSCIRNGIIHEEKIQFHDINKKVKQEYYYKKYDILINSMGVGTLGRISQVGQLNKEYLIHSCVSIIRADEKIINQFILGQELISIQKEIENMAQGTTGQTSLSNKELGKLKFFIPPRNIQNEVYPILKANIDTITHNLIENENLVQLRNALLPKLINGEINLDKIEI